MESNFYFNQTKNDEFLECTASAIQHDTENGSLNADAFNTSFSVGFEPFSMYGTCLSLLKI
jgi:hypothetical protein